VSPLLAYDGGNHKEAARFHAQSKRPQVDQDSGTPEGSAIEESV
jgi:hypothetical protein